VVKQELLSAKEVARKLGIGVRTWRRLVASGDAPRPRKFSARLVRWVESDIDKWARDHPPS